MITCPMKAWLSEFLFIREYFSGVTGKPLYSYLVKYEEYQKLRSVLIANQSASLHAVKGTYWAAIYCLYVAERFRRNYGEGSYEWSWEWADSKLASSFNHQQHAKLVEAGLAYWKRPIRKTATGRNFLGSLFLEGGLPWPLIQSETHGFGRVVRHGLKYFHRTQAILGNTTDLVTEMEGYLPHTFQNLDTRQLLAGVIEQLMYIAEKHPNLKKEADPVAYLDKAETNWRREFSIPISEANARNVINNWLHDASRHQTEKKEINGKQQHFSCDQVLLGDIRANWTIKTELHLPETYTFNVDNKQITSTRLEVAFYEGEKLVARGGVVYGQLQGNNKLEVRYPMQRVPLQRSEVIEPVSIVLLDNGSPIAQQLFEHSALDLNNAPLVFENDGDEKRLLCNASCNIENPEVLVRVPPGTRFGVNHSVVVQHQEDNGAQWLLVSKHLDIIVGDDLFKIHPNSSQASELFRLEGNLSTYNSLPKAVFKGWPTIIDDDTRHSHKGLREYVNGRCLDTRKAHNNHAGVINYVVKNEHNETLLRRRFGILPDIFDFTLSASGDAHPARLLLTGCHACSIEVYGTDIRVIEDSSSAGKSYQLHPNQHAPPSSFNLEIKGVEQAEPVKLRIPFPYLGVRLIDEQNQAIECRHLSLNQLLGKSLALFSARQDQFFYLILKLIDNSNIKIEREYSLVKPINKPLSISLFAYHDDIRQVLAAVKNQDAYVKLIIETPQQRLYELNIKRYNGEVRQDSANSFVAYEPNSDNNITPDVKMTAMLLSDPKHTPVELEEIKTQGIGTGRFHIHNEMRKDSPWLIYPHAESAIYFRPKLFISNLPRHSASCTNRPRSLHEAARLFHPLDNPDVIKQQIADMATDLDHSGWQYLDDLRKNYSHLPLSTFESWLSLSNNHLTLAVSLLRLEMDESFSDRMRDELAIIWESIPLRTWSDAYRTFQAWLIKAGLPDHYSNIMLQNRKSILKKIVSGFEEMSGYFETGDANKLPCIPPEMILPGWRDQLISLHENSIWPNELNSRLSSWTDKQKLPPLVKALSTERQHDAVIYLPVYMAFVTAGKVTLNELAPELPLPALKFYIRKLSDFDRNAWYNPAHALLASYLLANHKD